MAHDVHLDDQLCFALYAASRTVTGLYREPLTALDLTYPQYLVLMALWDDDGATIGDLGRRLHLDSGTLSPLVRRLERLDLVGRRPSTEDERRVHVHLTPRGWAVRDEAAAIQERLVGGLGLEADEVVALRSLARKLAALDHAATTTPTPHENR